MNRSPVRLTIFAASPVYYQAPLYRRLASDPRLSFSAIFGSTAGVEAADLGYGRPVKWDADALSGYRSLFLKRAAHAEISSCSPLRHRDFDVITELIRQDPEVLWVHGYNSLTHLLAMVFQLTRRRPLLVREEQTLLHGRPLIRRLVKTGSLGPLLRRSYALFIGTRNRQWFESYGVPPARQFFVPYAVDVQRLAAEALGLRSVRSSLRQELGLSDTSSPVILTVARLIPKKQSHVLLEAYRGVRERRACSLLFVGTGEMEAELRRIVAKQGIPDVVFAGFMNQSEITKAYAAADIFALPSGYDETWGLAVNEAMSCGLPVVVSDKVGCAPDLVKDGENGFVVRSGDARALESRLRMLVDSQPTRERFGAESLNHIGTWSYDVAADGLVQAVAQAVGPERWMAACASQPKEDLGRLEPA